MNPFRVLYYSNSECHPLTLAKAILVFDELNFFDHPSITFSRMGTVGHDSTMRSMVPLLKNEGYAINIYSLPSGPIQGEIERIIDVDLENLEFRRIFLQLIKNDPAFLMNVAPDGNYGKNETAESYRQKLQNTLEIQVPRKVVELNSYIPTDKISPEMSIGLYMALDAYKFNYAVFLAADKGVHLFGDSRGMDMLLNAKLGATNQDMLSREGYAHKMAFTLLERLVPNEAFRGKKIVDIARFRHEMTKEREQFKERILEATVTLQEVNGIEQKNKFNKILYKELIPEARSYQNKLAQNWDKFFKESTKAVVADTDHITQLIVTNILTHSFATALLTATVQIGVKVFPHLVDYLKEKEALGSSNPYTYLMRIK